MIRKVPAVVAFMRTETRLHPGNRYTTLVDATKCAHSARLWNSFVLDQPAVSNATKRRAEKVLGQNYDENSLLAVIVALDNFLFLTKSWVGFLDEYLELIKRTPAFHQGIANPHHS